jgi:hypothetical protein
MQCGMPADAVCLSGRVEVRLTAAGSETSARPSSVASPSQDYYAQPVPWLTTRSQPDRNQEDERDVPGPNCVQDLPPPTANPRGERNEFSRSLDPLGPAANGRYRVARWLPTG